MILDAEALIEKHRGKGVLVDANLLVLLLVGTVNPARIPLFKRTQNFTIEDFRLLEILINWFVPHLFSTPHVLSQASDLTDLKGKEGLLARQALGKFIEITEEYGTQAVISPKTRFSIALGWQTPPSLRQSKNAVWSLRPISTCIWPYKRAI